MKALFALFGLAGLTVLGQTSPKLLIERTAPQSLRIIWTNTASALALERSGSLGSAALWENIAAAPTEQNGQFSISVNAAQEEQFFRLRSLGLTTISQV